MVLPKSEREESSRKRKFEEDPRPLDKLKDLERAELQKLQKLYKDEREALDKKKKKAEEKERILEEKKIQQAIKRKENERRKERELEEKKRQVIAKRKEEEEKRRGEKKRRDAEKEERERLVIEEQKRKIEKQLKIREAQERARQMKLAQDKVIYSKRLEELESALSRLRKQEGELLRKKQRERAGHKDPILVENGKLQEAISTQLKLLREAFTSGKMQSLDFEESVLSDEVNLRDKALAKKLEEVDAKKARERESRDEKRVCIFRGFNGTMMQLKCFDVNEILVNSGPQFL